MAHSWQLLFLISVNLSPYPAHDLLNHRLLRISGLANIRRTKCCQITYIKRRNEEMGLSSICHMTVVLALLTNRGRNDFFRSVASSKREKNVTQTQTPQITVYIRLVTVRPTTVCPSIPWVQIYIKLIQPAAIFQTHVHTVNTYKSDKINQIAYFNV